MNTALHADTSALTRYRRIAWITLFAVYFLILVGAGVRASGAGMGCPDWPTCMNGEVFPTWSGVQGLHVLHRTLGYAVVVVTAIAAWAAMGHAGSRRWVATAAGLAILQVAVGVTNVLLRLPVEVTAAHSALAAGLVCCVGVSVREVWRRPAA